MTCQYVHLSLDEETAQLVGKRKTNDPVVLRVLVDEAHLGGVQFYRGGDGVWLSEPVPPRFLVFGKLDQ